MWSAYIFRLGTIQRKRNHNCVHLQAAKTLLLCGLYVFWVLIDWIFVLKCNLLAMWPGWRCGAAISILVYSAIFPGALGDVWMQRAAKNLSAPVVNVIRSLEPLFATALGMVLLGERMRWVGFLGGGLVFTAAVAAGIAEQ